MSSELSPRFPVAFDATDWCRAPRNLLLEGPRATTEATLRRLAPHLRGPVMWMRAAAFALPQGEVGVLILRDVGGLGPQEQTRLLTWIDAHPRTTIVSTTAHPLFAFVASELFDAKLYYRLNVLLLADDIETSTHGLRGTDRRDRWRRGPSPAASNTNVTDQAYGNRHRVH